MALNFKKGIKMKNKLVVVGMVGMIVTAGASFQAMAQQYPPQAPQRVQGMQQNQQRFAVDGYADAKVIKVEELTTTVTRNVCHDQQVKVLVDVPNAPAVVQAPPAPERSSAGMLLGAAVGALAGHQMGNGSGNTAATIAGAAGGAYLGDKIANRDAQNQPSQAQVRQTGTHAEERIATANVCQDVTESVPNGYSVTYRHAGATYTTHLMHKPGKSVRVAISVVE
jgi:uncharacterized protein YcfJ